MKERVREWEGEEERGGGGQKERGREGVKGAQEEKLVGATAILTTMHALTQASSGVSIYYLA